ncbi:cytochrome P450 71A21-like [Phalaenopsis equestris]|uniref:cytochrome P450 71A21-like n=1 Tax=Phalaenopsis equestris TaxID=78828 RepID=UPI0009E30E80|nr:cytochrome P450 71A21-like [Phalaenopsis equestris]
MVESLSSFLSSPIISLLLYPPFMLVILSITILAIILPSLFFPTRNNGSAVPLPPSPPKLPIIGNLHQLTQLPHRSLRALSDRHGPLMLLHLGRLPVLVASSPSVVREITQTHDHLFANRPFFKATHELFYRGRDVAFAPYGEYWREMKKMTILHLLSNKKVESYKQVRKEEVAFMIKEIERRTTTTAMDMAERFNALSRDVISRAVIGATTRRMWWGHSLRSLITDSSRLIGEFHVGDYIPWLGSAAGFVCGFERRLRKTFERTDKLLEEIVGERRRGMEKRKEEGDGDGTDECFLDVLLSLQEEMKCKGVVFDDMSIKAIIKDMFGAGTDSTSIPMEWAMAELLRHPTSMKMLKEEITNIVGSNETFIKEEQLAEMSYLKATVKEVLRLHPPGAIIVPRELTEDTTINGYRIPKGTMVLINAWAIGRDPKIWDSPEEFRPERFINGEGRDLGFINHGFQLLAFGAGRRSCPGIQFSVSLIELAIANLVHVFDWKPAKGEVKDIDMSEVYGLTTRKREALLLIAIRAVMQN